MCLNQQVKTQQEQKIKHYNLCQSRESNPGPLAARMRYLYNTESTESIDRFQAF